MADAVSVNLLEGDLTSRTFQLTSAGVALNLGTVTLTAVIKASQSVEDDALGVYTLTVGSGLTLVDAATGKVKVAFPSAITDSPGNWYYKIKVTSGSETETAVEGWVSVEDT